MTKPNIRIPFPSRSFAGAELLPEATVTGGTGATAFAELGEVRGSSDGASIATGAGDAATILPLSDSPFSTERALILASDHTIVAPTASNNPSPTHVDLFFTRRSTRSLVAPALRAPFATGRSFRVYCALEPTRPSPRILALSFGMLPLPIMVG